MLKIFVTAFYLDAHEVTNRQYLAFVKSFEASSAIQLAKREAISR